MSRPLPKPLQLIWGNQPYAVDQAAQQLVDSLLPPEERELSFFRFDADELLRPGGGETPGQRVDRFQLACESVPLFGGRYLVRLDRLERVKPAKRQGVALAAQLEAFRVYKAQWEGELVWVAEEDLLPGEPRGGEALLSQWAQEVEEPSGPALALRQGVERPQFLVSKGDSRHVLALKPYLKAKLKGALRFAVEEEEEAHQAAPLASEASARLARLLERLAKSPPPGLWLVLTGQAQREKELPAALLKQAQQLGRVQKFVTYDDQEPLEWIGGEAAKRGLPLNRSQCRLLVHYVGNDMGRLAGELDKLSLLFAGGGPVDEARLAQALHANNRTTLFQINDRLGRKELEGALLVLEQFLDESPHEHPVLIGVLARHFRQLYHIHTLSRLGVSDADLATHLKLHPFIAGRLKGMAPNFMPLELERILQALAQLDQAAKLHGQLTGVLFKDLVQSVCLGRFQRHPPAYLATPGLPGL